MVPLGGPGVTGSAGPTATPAAPIMHRERASPATPANQEGGTAVSDRREPRRRLMEEAPPPIGSGDGCRRGRAGQWERRDGRAAKRARPMAGAGAGFWSAANGELRGRAKAAEGPNGRRARRACAAGARAGSAAPLAGGGGERWSRDTAVGAARPRGAAVGRPFPSPRAAARSSRCLSGGSP